MWQNHQKGEKMFEQILAYQNLDAKVLKLKREYEKDPAKQNIINAMAVAKDYQNKLVELDSVASKTIADFEKNKKRYAQVSQMLEELNKQDASTLSSEDLSVQIDKINAISAELGTLERAISSLADSMSNILKNFDLYKQNIILSKQKYVENKQKLSQLEEKILPQVTAIKKQMTETEKDIDPKILAKYKSLRQDKIFPVFVPLNNNSCGGCSMSLAAASTSKLKDKGYLECEQCRRYIYFGE